MDVGHKRIGDFVVCDSCGVFEVLPESGQKAVAEVLLEMHDKQIDEFFYRAGLRFDTERRRVGFKALTPEIIKSIKKDGVHSSALDTLFDERPKEVIMKSLQSVLFGLKKRRGSH
ncbi:MAG: hypothetical protein KGH78_03985 [Candidatus Micrarchaeota archaeon]|nr:hypothetical protein [Candidatus Micrarchaeota archaeon]